MFIAPILSGGLGARTAVEGMGVEQIAGSPRALHVARHASTAPAATSALAGNGLAARRTDPSSGPERTAPEWSMRTDEPIHPSPATDGLAEARHLSRLADEMEAILRADARRHGIDV